MPTLERPDGASNHWEARGEGPPLYVFHNAMVSQPGTFSALLDDLARDHRIITFDGRGTGASTRHDAYDLATDVEDASALVDEVGPGGVAMAPGFQPVPLAMVASLPSAFDAVVLCGGQPPVRLDGDEASSWLLDSDSVASVARQMAHADPRALVRSSITLGNPQLDETEVREPSKHSWRSARSMPGSRAWRAISPTTRVKRARPSAAGFG